MQSAKWQLSQTAGSGGWFDCDLSSRRRAHMFRGDVPPVPDGKIRAIVIRGARKLGLLCANVRAHGRPDFLVFASVILGSAQYPELYDHRNHRKTKEEYPSVVMEFSVEEPRVDSSSKFCDGEDAKSVLGHRQRNRRQGEQSFPPSRAQEQMSQNHGGDDQHQTGANTAALARNFDVQS